MLLPFWFAASSSEPDGSKLKLRGIAPWVGSQPAAVSLPVWASTAKMARLSCPRLEPYRKRPVGCTMISAQLLVPLKSAGRVESVCMIWSAPRSGS